MIQITPHMRILVAVEPVDFRKGIDGMAQLCRAVLQQDPFDGTVFLFCNRRRTAVKLLVYDGQGFWLCQKRLSTGRLRFWPKHDEKATQLEAHQLMVLLALGNPNGVNASPPWRKICPKDKPARAA